MLSKAWNDSDDAIDDMQVEIERLRIGHERYEKVRRMSPRSFDEIYEKNLRTGIPFDRLVDEWESK